MTVNKVILVGNLGADPEIRQTNSGHTVANLRLATTSRVKRGDQWEDETEWHRVTVFGTTAENVERYCRKGKSLYIEGRIRTSKYQDKDGNDRWSTEVIADQVKFLGGRDDGDGGGGDRNDRGGDRGRGDGRGGSSGGGERGRDGRGRDEGRGGSRGRGDDRGRGGRADPHPGGNRDEGRGRGRDDDDDERIPF